jgi:putative NADH-flavin reductase
MKLCIFGADGRTGVEVVRYAVAQHYEVVAFVHSDVPSTYFPDSVVVKKGDIMNFDSVREAIAGTDAVISVIGHIKGSDPFMQTKGMSNIVRVMESLGVKRVLSLTGTGAREKDDTPSLIDRVLNFFVGAIDPERIKDGIAHVKVLKKSTLDWTVVRVLKLGTQDSEVSGYKLTSGGPAELLSKRKKVARVLVDLVNDTKYIGKAPVISG